MAYYHDLVTQKSWEELIRLAKLVSCVVIGGWAVYVYTKRLKSKDIDILVDFDALSTIQGQYAMTRNDRLKKYQAVRDVVEIDIYLPHFSTIGIPVEDLMGKTRVVEGFTVVDPDYLCALKLYTLGERGRTPKGRKDFLDILSLFASGSIDGGMLLQIIRRYRLDHVRTNIAQHLSESREAQELDLSVHEYARIKRLVIKALVL